MKKIIISILCVLLVGCAQQTNQSVTPLEKTVEVIETNTGTVEVTKNGKPDFLPLEVFEINSKMVVQRAEIEKNFSGDVVGATIIFVSKLSQKETVSWIKSYESKRKLSVLLDQIDKDTGEQILIFENDKIGVSYSVVPHSTLAGSGDSPTVTMIYKLK